jgi:hypothetical protein
VCTCDVDLLTATVVRYTIYRGTDPHRSLATLPCLHRGRFCLCCCVLTMRVAITTLSPLDMSVAPYFDLAGKVTAHRPSDVEVGNFYSFSSGTSQQTQTTVLPIRLQRAGLGQRTCMCPDFRCDRSCVLQHNHHNHSYRWGASSLISSHE